MSFFRIDSARKELVLGYAALLLGLTLFSTVEVASKGFGTGIPPLLLAAVRFILSGVVLLIPAWPVLRLRPAFSRCDWLILAGMAFFGVAVSIGLFHLAIPRLQANVAAILFSANPAFVILFSPWIIGEHITPRKIAGVLAGMGGMAVLALQSQHGGSQYRLGMLLMVGSLITFALYTVVTKKVLPRFGSVVLVCLTHFLGGIVLLAVSVFVEGNPLVHMAQASWAGILYLSVVATALAYWAYFFGIINVGATKGSMFFFLKPILASLFAWIFLGERISLRIVLGSIFVMLALILALSSSKKAVVLEP